MVTERLLQRLADLLLAEEAELQGIVFAAGADVVDEEVVRGDLVPLLGVVPVGSVLISSVSCSIFEDRCNYLIL
jgi:hypothetical protein